MSKESKDHLVQKKDRRVSHESPSDRDPLLLTSGQLSALVAHHCLQLLGQPLDETPGVCLHAGCLHLCICDTLSAKFDVFQDGRAKQDRLLTHKTDSVPQPPKVQALDVCAVQAVNMTYTMESYRALQTSLNQKAGRRTSV